MRQFLALCKMYRLLVTYHHINWISVKVITQNKNNLDFHPMYRNSSY